MLANEWLEQSQPGYRELSGGEKSAVAGFSIVWSVFEARALATNANAARIVEFVDQHAGHLSSLESFGESLAYFQQRYVVEGSFNNRFAHLNFRPNDRRALVEAVLLGNEQAPTEVIKALLIIAFRLRNNLFHGLKWAYEMRDQQRNFEQATSVLTRVLDRCRG